MKKGSLALFFLLLTIASQGIWCAADRSHRINGAHLRPHLQAEELHVAEGKKPLEIQVPRKLGQADEHRRYHEAKVPKRMAIAHKGGSTGGGTTGGASNVNGGPASHAGRKSAASLPVPATASILALAFTCAIVLSAFSF
ncbi:uncharacterized protein LOC102710427 [Oryza brachyantha]|uniref:Uncharacterized protein n=1 Tax=Oryza brachyantha TaxID=4533 RepID=J3MRQ7_ORYBR|nr:uncharacterized protein LOC102710427 [Oryza brachyantha]